MSEPTQTNRKKSRRHNGKCIDLRMTQVNRNIQTIHHKMKDLEI